MTATYTVQQFSELNLTGYATTLPALSTTNAAAVSELKGQHFQTLGRSGKFPALLQGSRDHYGYALSTVTAT